MTTKVLPPDWGAMGEAAKLFTRSLMMGLDSAVRKNEFAELSAEDVENLSYAEAVEYLKKRDVIKKVDYNKLSDKMRFRAFTASRIADGDLLKRINSELIKNVNDGKGLKDFLSLTKTDILNKVGMGAGGQGWYWETVYRTNVQTAYNTGRMMGFEEDKPLALHFVGIEDSRQTDVCHSLSNVIRPYDDPLWEKYIPPLHFGCRSTVRAIYDEDELPEEWTSLEGIEKPAKGFGTNPLENDSWWNELSSQVARAKEYGVQGEIEAAKVALGIEPGDVINNKTETETLFKTIEDVEEKFKQEDWFHHGTINGKPWRSDSELTLYGIDVKSASEFYDAYRTVFEKLPIFKNKFSAPGAHILDKSTYANSLWTYAGNADVTLNVHFFSSWEKISKEYAKDVAGKFHPAGTSAKAVFYHEIGHDIDCYCTEVLKLSHGKKTFSSYLKQKAMRNLKIKTGYDTITEELSEYAFEDAKEFFAEAFAEYFDSNNPRRLASEVIKLFFEELSSVGG